MNVFAVYHLMQHYIIYQQLMHTVNLIIWCYCIQCQCLVLATHNFIGLMMCSLLWVIVGYWKMSSAILNPNLRNSTYVHNTMRQEWAWLFCEQQMFYDELVGFKLPVPRWLASQMPRDTIDELRKALNRIREEIIEWRYVLIDIVPKLRFESQWRKGGTSMHSSCNHFLLIPFIN